MAYSKTDGGRPIEQRPTTETGLKTVVLPVPDEFGREILVLGERVEPPQLDQYYTVERAFGSWASLNAIVILGHRSGDPNHSAIVRVMDGPEGIEQTVETGTPHVSGWHAVVSGLVNHLEGLANCDSPVSSMTPEAGLRVLGDLSVADALQMSDTTLTLSNGQAERSPALVPTAA